MNDYDLSDEYALMAEAGMTFREILAALTTTPRSGCPTIPTRPAPPLAPDWACEVLSPSTRKLDLHGKRPIYAREGVEHLWLVDPADRTLEALELREGQCPFDPVTFNLGGLWP